MRAEDGDQKRTKDTANNSGIIAHSANRVKSLSSCHSIKSTLIPLPMKNMLNPNANPLYTGAYSMIGRASGSPSGGSSTTTTRLRPYHVRFVLVFTLGSPPSAPFSRSGERSSMLMPCTPRGVPGTGLRLLRREPVANGACVNVRPLRFVTEPCADAEPAFGACE